MNPAEIILAVAVGGFSLGLGMVVGTYAWARMRTYLDRRAADDP